MAEQMTGGCACGRVRYTATIADEMPICAIAGCASGDRLGVDRVQECEAGRRALGAASPTGIDSSPIA